jgi:glycosyltransferase involved in cell wall biosynthesis
MMTNSPRSLSVVITNYNYQAYVGTAIQSVLNQTHSPDEIIVIDDGSTDESRSVISSFGGRIRTIFKPNEGFKATTNRGFFEAKGELLVYLDADDLLYPNALAEVLRIFKPGMAKVQFDLDIIDRDGAMLGRRFCNFPDRLSAEDVAEEFRRTSTYIWPATSGNAYAREFLDKVMPMDPPVGIDGALNTIAPLYGQVGTISAALGQYRIHLTNMSQLDRSGNTNIVPDFARKINLRKREFDLLRLHASKLGKRIPDVDFLDNELVFVNYRLMARKKGTEDGDDWRRPAWQLWGRGLRLALRSPIPIKMKAVHVMWLTALFATPASLGRLMIEVRYNRTHLKSRVRHWFNTLQPTMKKR